MPNGISLSMELRVGNLYIDVDEARLSSTVHPPYKTHGFDNDSWRVGLISGLPTNMTTYNIFYDWDQKQTCLTSSGMALHPCEHSHLRRRHSGFLANFAAPARVVLFLTPRWPPMCASRQRSHQCK